MKVVDSKLTHLYAPSSFFCRTWDGKGEVDREDDDRRRHQKKITIPRTSNAHLRPQRDIIIYCLSSLCILVNRGTELKGVVASRNQLHPGHAQWRPKEENLLRKYMFFFPP
mmetsp:Transcript_26380/g.56065  ORF Transcript_26380/g.56065 Transcript_26380/m.56065 type:complete len:111 (-) Transcript_26380:3324-3656(-)